MFALNTNEAKACMCGDISIREAFNQVNSIFVGKVISGKAGKWNIKVNKVWKGKAEENIQLVDKSYFSTCSVEFTNNKQYIFFVNSNSNSKTQAFYFVPCLFDRERAEWSSILNKYDEENFWRTLKFRQPIKSKKL